jgi:hydrogenase nickel incorporation protein HypB
MIEEHLKDWDLQGRELLFLENVGNLVCPIGFDLGQHLKVLMLSTPEGEDKPLKYPPAFAWADVVLIGKMDMAEAAGFDLDFALQNIKKSNPKAIVIQTSARTGQGLEDWLKLL